MSKMTRELKSEIVQIVNESLSEDLTNKLCSKVFKQIDKRLEAWEGKFANIDALSSNLAKLDKLDDLAMNVADLNASLKGLNDCLDSNKKSILVLNKTCEQIQQNCKSNQLRFCGFGEIENENPVEIIAKFVSTQLKIPCVVQDIDHAFRLGKMVEGNNRTILVKFVNFWKRSQILNAKKSLKGAGISLFEDLTKDRYEVLMAAKKKYGKHQAWSAGGKIFAFSNGKKILINNK